MHYLSLEKDFSNIDEVTRAIKDTDFLERIANNARSELIESGKYSFESFIIGFDESLELLAKEKIGKQLVNAQTLPNPCR